MSSSCTPESIEKKISESLQGVQLVKATDISNGCGARFEIEIVAEEFKGKPLLAQHRLVYKLLEEETKQIHAITLKTKAP